MIGYHLPHVHPDLSKLLDYRNYDTKLFDWYSYQFGSLDDEKNNNADIYYGEGDAHYYCIFKTWSKKRSQINLFINLI